MSIHVLRSSAEQMLRRSEQPCVCTALGVSLDAIGAATNLDEVVNGDRLMKDGGRRKKAAQRRRLASSRPTRLGWQHTAAALLASLLAWPRCQSGLLARLAASPSHRRLLPCPVPWPSARTLCRSSKLTSSATHSPTPHRRAPNLRRQSQRLGKTGQQTGSASDPPNFRPQTRISRIRAFRNGHVPSSAEVGLNQKIATEASCPTSRRLELHDGEAGLR